MKKKDPVTAESSNYFVLGSFWGRFEIVLELFWGRSGFVLGSFWVRFGIVLGSFWGRVGVDFDSPVIQTRLFLRSIL